MLSSPTVGRLAQSIEATGELIAGVRDDQWSATTPCAEWDVRALVNHLVVGDKIFTGMLRGEPPLPPDQLARLRTVDQLGDKPVDVYLESGAALQAAFDQPGVLEREVRSPFGHSPGSVLLHLRITETLVHGWDLARATGQPIRIPDEVVEEALAFSRGPRAPNVPRTGHPFGPAQEIADDAPAIDRLAAYLGRPPNADPGSLDHG